MTLLPVLCQTQRNIIECTSLLWVATWSRQPVEQKMTFEQELQATPSTFISQFARNNMAKAQLLPAMAGLKQVEQWDWMRFGISTAAIGISSTTT